MLRAAPVRVLRFQRSSKVQALHTTLRPAGHRILASKRGADATHPVPCPHETAKQEPCVFTGIPRCRRCVWHRGGLVSLLPRQLLFAGRALSKPVVCSQHRIPGSKDRAEVAVGNLALIGDCNVRRSTSHSCLCAWGLCCAIGSA